MDTRLFFRSTVFCLLAVVLVASSAAAQTRARVRVAVDRATIWRPGFTTPATVVAVGTVLEVVARQGDWYEVVLPASSGLDGTGMIAIIQVVLAPGSPIPAEASGQSAAARTPPDPTAPPPSYSVRGFGTLGYDWMVAHKAFNAVLGQSGGVVFGAGGQFRWNNRIVIEGSVERFRRTGQRVFASDTGEVFRLGIPDTITIVPLTFTVAYRLSRGNSGPYVGGGVGRYFYKEQSTFADPSENVDQQFTSYHVRGGYEWQDGILSTAFELQYSHVPNALEGGAAAAFNEHNLGGVQVRVKVMVGK
jgi:hypothetical protein